MKNLLLVLSLVFVFAVNLYSGIKYVNSNASGLNNGTSWTNAYTSFQSALTTAVSGDQIWVAKGTYKPSSAYDSTSTSRYYHFRMISGVAIYGGFYGTETSLSERNWNTNVTILSGDLDGDDGAENWNNRSDNCYHVFYHSSGLASSAILDGFTIKGGNANGDVSPHYNGGGMYNDAGSSPSLTNCTFSSNSAGVRGGGMFNAGSSPSLTNCTFSSNSAQYGGGMLNAVSSPSLTNCIFSSNSAQDGGGMFNSSSSSPTLTNCTFTSNSVTEVGGGMFNDGSSPTLNNCIIWGNTATAIGDEFYISGGTTTLFYSCYANAFKDLYGSLTSLNCITSDPLFVGSSINPTHPYSILGISPCADAGNDSYNFQAYDIRGEGYPRKLNKTTGGVGTIDMGAYEYKIGDDPLTSVETGIASTPKKFTLSQNYPNPFNPSTVISYQLPVNSFVTLKVYDVLGNEVATLVNEEKQSGNYEVSFNTQQTPPKADNNRQLTSGVYFYQLRAGSFVQTKKFILLK